MTTVFSSLEHFEEALPCAYRQNPLQGEHAQGNTTSIGIVGGMGPLASAEFLRSVLNYIPVEKDWEYPRIILDSNPHIPSRSRCYLYGEASPLPGMVDACQRLEQYGVCCIALPCNSAQAWLGALQEQIATPIADIRRVTVNALRTTFPACRKAVVFGSAVTWGKNTYQEYLNNEGVDYIRIAPSLQHNVESFIELAKKNNSLATLLPHYESLTHEVLRQYGNDVAIILGCTEFGLLQGSSKSINAQVVDSLTAYAMFVAKVATKEEWL